jgi:membrane fusion protein, multidrug efflux system
MKKVVKYLFLIAVITAFTGCDKNEMVKQQLEGKKKKLEKLTKEIEQLESMVNDSTAGAEEKENGKTVAIKEMQPDTFRHFIEINSKAIAENDAMISSEMSGQVKKIYVNEGQRVAVGQILVSLNTEVTQSSIEEINTMLELSDSLYKKQKSLYEQGIGSEVQYLQAKSNYEQMIAKLKTLEAQKNMSIIYAPFAGIVEKIYMKQGELSSPGMPVLHLVNLHKLKVYGDISEDYLTTISKKQPVEVVFPLYNNLSKKVPVQRIGSVIDDNTRTFEIEIKINNYDEKIKPNSMATIRINDYTNYKAFLVPANCVQKDLEDFYVYKAVKNNKGQFVAEKVTVKTGVAYQDKIEIEKGISAGDKVITVGYNLIAEEGSIINIKE